jgi:hypothetical protein
MASIYTFCTARDVVAIEPAYEKAMTREIELICRYIPHRDLCIQWDVCHDMIVWDGQPQDQLPLVKASEDDIARRFVRICAPVPDDVQLGSDLCYGDFGGKHFFDPVTARHLVDILDVIVKNVPTQGRICPSACAGVARDRRILRAHERAYPRASSSISALFMPRTVSKARENVSNLRANTCRNRNCDGMRLRSRAQTQSGPEADRYSRRSGERAWMIRVP